MLQVNMLSPWVRVALRDDPMQAMTVLHATRTTTLEGTLVLLADSPTGPFFARVGEVRAEGSTVASAVERVLAQVAS